MNPHLYSLCRLIVLMATLTFVLWMNATSFDETEIKTIIIMFISAAGIEGGLNAVTHMRESR